MIRTIAVAVLAASLLSACTPTAESSAGPDTVATTPSTAATPTASPATPPAETTPADQLFTPAGVGPYKIGERPAAGLVAEAAPVDPQQCPDLYSAQSTGAYTGMLLTIRNGVLVEIQSAQDAHTPEKAEIGMTLAEVKKLYGARATSITGEGGVKALIVKTGRTVTLLSEGPPHRTGVVVIAVGLADHTEKTFTDASPC
jgi:hypothetical protein